MHNYRFSSTTLFFVAVRKPERNDCIHTKSNLKLYVMVQKSSESNIEVVRRIKIQRNCSIYFLLLFARFPIDTINSIRWYI